MSNTGSEWGYFSTIAVCSSSPKVRFTQTEAGTATAVKIGAYYGAAVSLSAASSIGDTINRGAMTVLAFTNDGVAGTNPTKGTIVEDTVTTRQVGDQIEFNYKLAVSSNGTAGTGAYVFQLPAGMTFGPGVNLTTGWISLYTCGS